jgi:hypothetical protein
MIVRFKRGAWICVLAQLAALIALPGARASSSAEPGASPVPERPFLAAAEDSAETRWTPQGGFSRRNWGLIGSGAGLVAGVAMAIWVKSEADDRYDIYLNTADPDEARKAFDEAQRYDRATLVGWGLAQVSFVAFVYFLTREKGRPLVPVQGEPVVRPQGDGLQVGFRFTP